MNVKLMINKDGTTDDTPPNGYSSWKNYWETKKGVKFPNKCCVLTCNNTAEVGAHVILFYYGIQDYIVPMCREHNNPNNKDIMAIDEKYLVKIEN